jgi:tricorn protease
MLVTKGDDFHIFDSTVKATALRDPKVLAKARMDLARWTFDTNPGAEFHELFVDAWRLERDYF